MWRGDADTAVEQKEIDKRLLNGMVNAGILFRCSLMGGRLRLLAFSKR